MTRRSWLAERTDDLERELDAVGLIAPRSELERKLGEHVEAVAAQSGTTVRTARQYVTPATIRMLARRLAEQLADEAPGLDLIHAPKSCPVPIFAVGALVAALTEAVQLAKVGDDSSGFTAACALLSTLGVLLRDNNHPAAGTVDLPPALLTRAARVLDNAVDRVRNGAPLQFGADEEIRPHFADRLADDATLLRHLSDNRTDPPPRPSLRSV